MTPMFRSWLGCIVIAGFPLLGCDGPTTGPGADVGWLLVEVPATLQIHETSLLSARVVGAGRGTGQDGSVTWTSSDPNIVRVESGIVTGVRRGTATLTAHAGRLQATRTLKVHARLRIRVMPSNGFLDHFFLTQGDSIRLVAVPVDVDGEPVEEPVEIAWSSSNPRSAVVAGTGIVVGNQPGQAVVRAMSSDGEAGQITIEVLWNRLAPATLHLVHLASGLGDVSFSLDPGLTHTVHFGESTVLTASPGGLVSRDRR